MKNFFAGLTVSLLMIGVSLNVYAQGITTGTLSGTVADTTGAVISDATITATKGDTNAVFTAVSGSNGAFSLVNLPIGSYSVKIVGQGFAALTLSGVVVNSNRENTLGIEKLSPGGNSTSIEVSATAGLLETTQSQVSTTFDTQQVENLPTAGGFDELALLIPGVVATHDNNFSNTNGVGISSNGQRGRSNNFEIDGQSNNDNSVAGPQFFFSNEEAIEQIQVITNNFSAAYGRNMGSVVNYLTKSGTNSIHGSAFYRYSGDFSSSLSQGNSKGPQFGFCAVGENPADGCTVPVVPRFVNNIYGGNVTAPILKDKLFVAGSFYGNRFFEHGSTTSSGTSLVPTTAAIATLAGAFPNNPAVTTLQQLNPLALALGSPKATGTPVNRTISNGVTTVTVPFTQIARQFSQSSIDQEYLGKMDYQATSKDRFSARYIYQKDPTSPDNPTASGGTVNVGDITHSAGIDWTRTFSARWVNQLRYSFQQSKLAFDGGDYPSCTINSFTGCPASIGLGTNNAGLGLGSGFPQGRTVKVGQTQDNATFSWGRHAITFGGEFDYQNSPNVFLPNQSGSFSFTTPVRAGVPGYATAAEANYSAFFQGIGTVNITQGSPTVPFREKDVAVYFQDDWKITPSFTANLGLRWEFFQQAINLLHDRSLAQQTGPMPFWNTALPLSVTTFPQIPQSYRNFEPRIGFAYNPEFAKKLVVRGGFAINVDPGFYNINLNSATSAPVVNAGTVTCTGVATATAPASCLPTSGGATYSAVNAYLSPYIPRGVNPGTRNETLVSSNFRQPMAESYSFGAQYQFGRVGVLEARYNGNHTFGNFQTLNGDPYLLPVATDFPNFIAPSSLCTAATSTLSTGGDIGRLRCGNSNVRLRANTAFSLYNAFQSSFTTRNYHGVNATFAFTFSKTIDNSSEIFGTNAGGNSVAFSQNPLDPNFAERAISGIDFPKTGSISFTYAVPTIGSGSGLLSKVINGWQANTIWLYNSGQPYTPIDTYINSSPVTNDLPSYESYSDAKQSSAFGGTIDAARPILSNKNAPIDRVGIYTTTGSGATLSQPFLVDYETGASVTPNSVHWIANNRYAARLAGNPFPGSARNLSRGNTYNNVDLSVFKNTKISERVTFRLEANAYNVLNRSYYGAPDTFLGDDGVSFGNFTENGAGGSNIGPGTGVRNMSFGGKFIF